jgi:ABC-type transporter Mla maintaining outer membrane lipid asymmetry ATPase subunit MlaF
MSGADAGGAPVVVMRGVRKSYQGLRPLRIDALEVRDGERVALSGIDAGAAEVFVNLVTGAGLPDAGEVRVFGRETAAIAGADEWLASLERFGIVSPRAVLLEGSTIEQNLALPFTLEIDPVPADVADRVVALARECGIPEEPSSLARRAGEAPPDIRARVHLARAIALAPDLLVLEHPTLGLPDNGRAAFAGDIARVAGDRGLATLLITQDERFAKKAAHRVLQLQPATGVLKPRRRGWLS